MATTDAQPSPEETEETQARMTFGEHLEELRKRIMQSLYGAVFGVGVCIYYMYDIFDLVARPYRIVARAHHVPDVFNTLKPQEGFMTLISLAIKAGLIVTSPWIIYQLWQFVAAGLYPRERKIIYRYVGPSALLFLLGVAFFYFIVLPMTLSFFFSFTSQSAGPVPQPNLLERKLLGVQEPAGTQPATATAPATMPVLRDDPPPTPEGQGLIYYHDLEGRVKLRVGNRIISLLMSEEGSMFTNIWRAEDYLGFVAFTALIFGVAFEMPMVILILAQVGIVQTQTFRNVRKYAYFGILIAAVAAAPSGDLMTLLFLFIPLVLLYELGIVLAAIVVGRRAAAE
jgi:sec-independent protein translocase protein TatC